LINIKEGDSPVFEKRGQSPFLLVLFLAGTNVVPKTSSRKEFNFIFCSAKLLTKPVDKKGDCPL
jgi:hypothetical protein